MNNNSFDLPGFLLGEVYGPMKQEGERLVWSMADAISLADDLKQHDGIDADPQEIFELMMEFDRQDAEESNPPDEGPRLRPKTPAIQSGTASESNGGRGNH